MGSGRSKSSRTSWTSFRSLFQVGAGVVYSGSAASRCLRVLLGEDPLVGHLPVQALRLDTCTVGSSLKVTLRGVSGISWVCCFPSGMGWEDPRCGVWDTCDKALHLE